MNQPKRIKVASRKEDIPFDEQGVCVFESEGNRFCMARHDDRIFAFQARCPHAGADLSKGAVDKLGNVICPLHHYRFSLATGRNVSGEGYFLKRYAVGIEEDGIYVELPPVQ